MAHQTKPTAGVVLAALAVVVLCFGACGGDSDAPPPTTGTATGRAATARLEPLQGETTRGTVTFTEVDGAVLVEASIAGIPEGNHGFHIHARDRCSLADSSSLSSHFAPDSARHGRPDAAAGERHAGDLGNIFSRGGGVAAYSRLDSLVSLHPGPHSVVGHALVVHRDPDDFLPPDGHSGPPLACGIIRLTAAGDGVNNVNADTIRATHDTVER